jgi:hypothetical protein
VQEELAAWTRIWIGAVGALIAVICKGIFQELPFVMRLVDTDQQDKVVSEMYGFIAFGLGLLILGAAASWYFDEKSRRACFAMGLAGPALIGTIAGGNFSDVSRPPPTRGGWNIEQMLPISSANAAELLNKPSSADKGSLWEGLKLVVGVGKDQSRYYVVAGPFKNENEASALGTKIMREHPKVPVFSWKPASKDAPVMLVIGNSLPYPSARSLRDDAKDFPELKDVKDISLSPSAALESADDQRLSPH